MKLKYIKDNCSRITTEAINSLLSQRQSEDIYAYALYTDSSAMSISFGANSVSNFNNRLATEDEVTSEDVAYFKWNTAEWEYESYAEEKFENINNQLSNLSLTMNESEFQTFFEDLITIMTEALKIAKTNTTKETKKSTFFITVTDDDIAEEIENKSATVINTPEVAKLFLRRYN